jgi:uncharacterized protein YjiS (DUF1127 family)
MNGFSDVRLSLYSRELSAGQAGVTLRTNAPKLGRWALYCHRWTSRRALLNLTREQLQDIGLEPGLALREGMKPFWRE